MQFDDLQCHELLRVSRAEYHDGFADLNIGLQARGVPYQIFCESCVDSFANGPGTTLLPKLAVDGGSLLGTNLVTRGLAGDEPARKVGLLCGTAPAASMN
jgi:hypothetical protein